MFIHKFTRRIIRLKNSKADKSEFSEYTSVSLSEMPLSSSHNMFSYSVILIWLCFICGKRTTHFRFFFFFCIPHPFCIKREIFNKIYEDFLSSIKKGRWYGKYSHSSMVVPENFPMNRRTRFSELWKWISSYSEYSAVVPWRMRKIDSRRFHCWLRMHSM